MEAASAAGDVDVARGAARKYLDRFQSGRFASLARGILSTSR
jgi:hypothetical protein